MKSFTKKTNLLETYGFEEKSIVGYSICNSEVYFKIRIQQQTSNHAGTVSTNSTTIWIWKKNSLISTNFVVQKTKFEKKKKGI